MGMNKYGAACSGAITEAKGERGDYNPAPLQWTVTPTHHKHNTHHTPPTHTPHTHTHENTTPPLNIKMKVPHKLVRRPLTPHTHTHTHTNTHKHTMFVHTI